MVSSYKVITAYDVDKFIQFPQTININTADHLANGGVRSGEDDIILTVVQEDVILENFDKHFLIDDYAIYASIPKANLFNPAMDWKYIVQNSFDDDGTFVGPRVLDAHANPANSIAEPIINVASSKTKLGVEALDTRFVHYRQCDRFFKYSYRIGDPVTLPGNKTGHVFAVYLDSLSGDALPYWLSTSSGQEPEYLKFYYADLDLGSEIGLTSSGISVAVVCPPHPDFIASGNLAFTREYDGSLLIRPLALNTTSHTYTEDDFVLYTEHANRELYVYVVIEPDNTSHFQGEIIKPIWTSKQISASWGPIRDILDDFGHRVPCPVPASLVREVDRFVITATVAADTFMDLSGPQSPRMYYPSSRMVVKYAPDSSTNNEGEVEDFPFSFDIANETTFNGDTRKSIIGGRIMQLVSMYMFDSAMDKDMAYFPYLLNEAKSLTDTIIADLGVSLLTSRNSRNSIIEQIVIKYGREHFDEMAVYTNPEDGSSTGDMWQVISRISELFMFFTVSVKTTISTGAKNRVEVIQLVQVPVVLRVHDNVS